MHIKLFETYCVSKLLERYKLEVSKRNQSEERLTKLDEETISKGLSYMYHWFAGSMMSSDDDLSYVADNFKKIGDLYDLDKPARTLYRTVHLRLPETNMPQDDILSIDKTVTGPKSLQSWSTTKEAAEFFFNHFVKEQNMHDRTRHNTAWVIVEAKHSDVELLITFEACLQFMADVFVACDDYQMKRNAKVLLDSFYDPDMLDLHEYICDVTGPIPVKVADIIVPPLAQDKRKLKNAA